MRVWMVNQYAIPPNQAGGTRHFFLARELVRRGHDVTIVASSFDHASRRETRLHEGETWRIEEVDGVRFLWLRTPPYPGNTVARMWNMLVFAWRVLRSAGTKMLDRPDVIVGSSPHLFAAWSAARLADRYGIPFVVEIRDLWPQTLVDLGKVSTWHPLVFAMEALERYLYRKAARIITLLPGAHEHIIAKGASGDKIVWIPNGVDLQLLPPQEAPQEPLKKQPLFTVMYAGSHGLANGLDSILEAAAQLQREGWADRVRVRFVGEGPAKARLEERAIQEGLTLVRFEPAVPKYEVYHRLQQADAFIVTLKDSPLYRWGMSLNKIFDYLACARPIIFGATLRFNPVEAAGAGIVVPPEDSQAMAAAIKQLAQMPSEIRRQMGTGGRDYVEQHHAFATLAANLEAVLTQVTLPKSR